MLEENKMLQLFRSKKALLEGHFELSSGKHSAYYLQCALMLQYPDIAEMLCKELAGHFTKDGITVVVGPALGGVVVAHELARALGVRAVFAERKNGILEIRRGFSISSQDRVLLVEDVVTTGGSILEVAKLIEEQQAHICGYAAIIDRRDIEEFQICSLIRVNFPIYEKKECPLCAKGSFAVKPGSKV
ncbi:MAG: orotate phosphoribosyltransferase [Chlamydiota bacterium]|nr:orotate phosphoribosyltransferase [Chlamydiota bacterium]